MQRIAVEGTGILRNGDRVRMSGLGIIEVEDRNPATAAPSRSPARKKVAVRANPRAFSPVVADGAALPLEVRSTWPKATSRAMIDHAGKALPVTIGDILRQDLRVCARDRLQIRRFRQAAL
jgi:hypothetical protein